MMLRRCSGCLLALSKASISPDNDFTSAVSSVLFGQKTSSQPGWERVQEQDEGQRSTIGSISAAEVHVGSENASASSKMKHRITRASGLILAVE